MKLFVKIFFIGNLVVLSRTAVAQDTAATPKKPAFFSYDSLHQVDVFDIAKRIIHKKTSEKDSIKAKPSRVHITAVPAAGYSLQTGWAAILTGNIVFTNSSKSQDNISTIISSFTYSQYKQYIIPLHVNIWLKNGEYNFQSEWRYLKYPSFTYGLGTRTTLDDGYMIDYSYARLHQSISKKIATNLYAGIGYDADIFWKIRELDPDPAKKTDFQQYGLFQKEVAAGPTVHLLFDSRRNSINPENGSYLNLSWRPKFKFMGSDANWESVLVEYKAYKKFPGNSDNVLAFWNYDWFTFGGKPPYLLLPSTGWDDYVNTGRGYIQGRYRGSNMLYAETEYRFLITSNGLFGGVLFANAQTFSSRASTLAANANFKTFDPIQPGYGAGIRVKINKFSRANLCVDYGWGSNGSKGVAVNLGEVF